MRCTTVGLIVVLALGLLGVPLAAGGQQPGKVPRLVRLKVGITAAETPRGV